MVIWNDYDIQLYYEPKTNTVNLNLGDSTNTQVNKINDHLSNVLNC